MEGFEGLSLGKGNAAENEKGEVKRGKSLANGNERDMEK